METKFKEGIKEIVENAEQETYSEIKKSILKGIKNYLSLDENLHKVMSEALDIDLFMDDNVVVNFVRTELYNMQENMLKRSADKISDLLDKLLEEV